MSTLYAIGSWAQAPYDGFLTDKRVFKPFIPRFALLQLASYAAIYTFPSTLISRVFTSLSKWTLNSTIAFSIGAVALKVAGLALEKQTFPNVEREILSEFPKKQFTALKRVLEHSRDLPKELICSIYLSAVKDGYDKSFFKGLHETLDFDKGLGNPLSLFYPKWKNSEDRVQIRALVQLAEYKKHTAKYSSSDEIGQIGAEITGKVLKEIGEKKLELFSYLLQYSDRRPGDLIEKVYEKALKLEDAAFLKLLQKTLNDQSQDPVPIEIRNRKEDLAAKATSPSSLSLILQIDSWTQEALEKLLSALCCDSTRSEKERIDLATLFIDKCKKGSVSLVLARLLGGETPPLADSPLAQFLIDKGAQFKGIYKTFDSRITDPGKKNRAITLLVSLPGFHKEVLKKYLKADIKRKMGGTLEELAPYQKICELIEGAGLERRHEEIESLLEKDLCSDNPELGLAEFIPILNPVPYRLSKGLCTKLAMRCLDSLYLYESQDFKGFFLSFKELIHRFSSLDLDASIGVEYMGRFLEEKRPDPGSSTALILTAHLRFLCANNNLVIATHLDKPAYFSFQQKHQKWLSALGGKLFDWNRLTEEKANRVLNSV